MRYRQITVQILAAMFSAWAGVSHAATTGGNAAFAQSPERFAIIAQSSNRFGGYGPTAMTIDIKPDDPDNIVSASAGRIIPVAILGSSDLDITAINPRTIRLNGVDIMLVGKSDKSLCQAKDINGDGYDDLVCDVRTTGFKVDAGEYQIIIKAGTYSGESLSGEDRISIVRN